MQLEICANGAISILELINGENHRRCLSPGDSLAGESQTVINAATAAWTPAIISAHAAAVAASALTPVQIAKEKAAMLEEAREMRSEILNALTGIQMYDISPSDTTALNAISAARTALKNLPSEPTVVAAVDGPGVHAAVMTLWETIAANLAAASPAAAVAFKKTAMW